MFVGKVCNIEVLYQNLPGRSEENHDGTTVAKRTSKAVIDRNVAN